MADTSRNGLARMQMWLNRTCAVLSGVAMLAMMIAGAADVIMTNLDVVGLQSRPVPGVHEFIGTMMVLSVFLAVSLAQARRSHIQVDIITRLLPRPVQTALSLLQSALGVAVFGLIAWFGWKVAGHSVSTGEFAAGLFDFPIWPSRIVLAFGATLMAIQCLFDFIATLAPSWSTTDDQTDSSPTAVH